jgi:hypothetical protein
MLSQSSHSRLGTKSTCIEDSGEFPSRDETNFFQLVFERKAMVVRRVCAEGFYQLGFVLASFR